MQSIGEKAASMCAEIVGLVFNIFLGVGEKIANAASLKDNANGEEGTILTQIWTYISSGVESAIDALVPLGLALCMLFFIISLLELAMSERMTMEYFVKYFSKLIIGVAAVWKSQDIWKLIIQFGDSLGSLAVGFTFGTSGDASGDVDTLIATLTSSFGDMASLKGAAIWIMLVLVILMIFPIMALAGVAMTIVGYIVCYSRVLELCVRGIFLPIACSLLSDDGWRGAGGRYIRKLMAVSAQGVILIIIGKVTTGIMAIAGSSMISKVTDSVGASGTLDMGPFIGDFISTSLSGMGLMLGVGIACISIMFKSIGIINDVFGG